MEKDLARLRAHLAEITDLTAASHMLMWDQATFMPPGGGAARGRQLTTLGTLSHGRATDPALGRLLDTLEARIGELDPDGDDAALIREARRDFDRATRLPEDFVSRFSAHTAQSYAAWENAREANDFRAALPELERGVELSREFAGYYPEAAHPADALIEESDPGMTVADMTPVFAELRAGLVPLAKQLAEASADAPKLPAGPYPEDAQMAFSHQLAEAVGYDFSRGRLDLSPHPFTTGFSIGDVRITTRMKPDDPVECMFSTLHEAGHGMYEQGIARTLEGTPLATGTSSGVHESQSRLWENLVGRSRPFWVHWYPSLQKTFGNALSAVSMDDWLRAINRVAPSLIRTDADEVTYNLHVMLRFELELAMLEGRLKPAELDDAWRAAMAETVGVTPQDANSGALQDVHWWAGPVGGAFQGYTLGNLTAAQLFDSAEAAHPDIFEEMTTGRYDALRGWLTENVWRYGRKRTARQVVEGATGKPLSAEPFLRHLTTKYQALFG
ncbi:MAG: carboxypeptidase M32 [Leptospirillia bacterium]